MPATRSWPRTSRARRCSPTSACARRLAVFTLAAAVLAGAPSRAGSEDAAAAERETCLACHSDASNTLRLPSGEEVPLVVDGDSFVRSVHGAGLKCTDCHAGFDAVPHPEQRWKDRAEMRAGLRESCKSCHFDTYRQSLDGVHHALQGRGDPRAPSCTDCHGAHEIAPAAQPRSRISRTCATCHQEVSAAYARSVHGRALDGNPDVPVCTDCHRSHDIADPRTDAWRLATPQLCGKCHTDPKRMAKYGLSTSVVQTYLADFHGMSASLRRAGGGAGRLTALCTDCHGIHDIAPVQDSGSPAMRANLQRTCAKCHAGASATFPAAWLSHYEPGWSKTPLVYGVKVFYAVFIPFVIGGLVLQILLHLWRAVVNR
jgi:hypothetical protein